jgi:protein gp37
MAHRLACMALKDDRSEEFHVDGRGKYAMVIYNGKWNGNTYVSAREMELPYRWKKRSMIFVCSMGDLFHESVSFEDIKDVFRVINFNPIHTFQILTKRPERMVEFFKWLNNSNIAVNFPNLWIGVTVENQEMANKRIPILLQIPAAIRFVSIEPMLGPVDIHPHGLSPDRPSLDWVICGGETGPKARPINCIWVEYLLNQCKSANVPFFFKSWGGKKKSGHLLDGIEYHQFPNTKSMTFSLNTDHSLLITKPMGCPPTYHHGK